MDAVSVADILPEHPGLEIVSLEENGGWVPFSGKSKFTYFLNRVYRKLFGASNHVYLSNIDGVIWKTHFKHKEPQNAAVGNFDTRKNSLEIWCRSRNNTHQQPFVFDAQGKMISTYKFSRMLPENWTDRGVELISAIHWDGGVHNCFLPKNGTPQEK